jgi:tetratricopeptide (TPR) repeat protein
MTNKRLQQFFILLGIVFAVSCDIAHASGLPEIEAAILSNDYANARTLAEEVIGQNPAKEQLLLARYYLGLSLLNLEKYPESQEEFQKILAATPGDKLYDKARLGTIDSIYLQGEYDKALAEAQDLLKTRPHSESMSLIYLKIARASYKLSQWKEARKYLRKIIKEFPNSPENHIARQLTAEKRYFAVQVGSFKDRQRAIKLMRELYKRGEYAYIVETIANDGARFYRVRAGRLSRLDHAESLKTKLSDLGYPARIYP